jgi:hypothetical protein
MRITLVQTESTQVMGHPVQYYYTRSAPYMRITLVQTESMLEIHRFRPSTFLFHWTNKRHGPGNILKRRVIFSFFPLMFCQWHG